MLEQKNTEFINFVRIHTFKKQEQIAIIKAKLESEGILTRIENEHINTLYREAIGEIHLLVPNIDVIRARKVLEDAGIEVLKEQTLSPWLMYFNQISSKIPHLSTLSLEKRLVLFGVLLALILFIPLFLLTISLT